MTKRKENTWRVLFSFCFVLIVNSFSGTKQRRGVFSWGLPSMLRRTFFTLVLQPWQWMETFKTHVCKNREKEHKKSKTVGKREEKKEVGLGANVQTWKLIPYISGVAQRVLQLQLLLLLLLKPWGRERERLS